MSVGRSIKFSQVADATTTPAFDPDAVITVESFADIVGPYQFDRDVKCQLLTKVERCGHDHRSGWVVVSKTGVEAFIGSTCGPKYLGQSADFVAARRRVGTEQRIDALLERLGAIRADAEYGGRLEHTTARLRSLRAELDELRDSLPESAARELRERALRRAAGIAVQWFKVERESDGTTTRRNLDGTAADIIGLAIWDRAALVEAREILERARRAHDEYEISADIGERRLKEWAEAMEASPRAIALLDDIESALEMFRSPTNLRWLPFLVRSDADQEATADAVIELLGPDVAEARNGRELVRLLRQAVRDRQGGWDFRLM